MVWDSACAGVVEVLVTLMVVVGEVVHGVVSFMEVSHVAHDEALVVVGLVVSEVAHVAHDEALVVVGLVVSEVAQVVGQVSVELLTAGRDQTGELLMMVVVALVEVEQSVFPPLPEPEPEPPQLPLSEPEPEPEP